MELGFARELATRLAGGDLDWLRGRFAAGELDELREYVAAEDWAQLSHRLRDGDLPWIRRVLGAVSIPGIGALGTLMGSSRAPGSQPAERDRRRMTLWLAVALLALLGVVLAVAVSSCSSDGDESPATTAAPAGTATTEAATTEAATTEAAATEAATTEAAATEAATTEAATTEPATTEATTEEAAADLVDTIAGADGFATLTDLLEQAGLVETLRGDGPFTVFAPSDDAFAALPEEVVDALGKNPDVFTEVLTYHVVPGRLMSTDFETGTLETAQGQSLDVAVGAGGVTVNAVKVTQPDIAAANGVIHGIDAVLLPPDLDLEALVGAEAAAEAIDRADYVVFFESGSSTLDAKAQATVDEAASAIADLPSGSKVRLVGIPDPSGDAAANRQLSLDRASSVQVALEQAVPGAGVTYVVKAKGEEEGTSLSNARRVDVVLP
jgi:uncharacterized surface protein with fasciclin (FAS1) repeats